MKEQPIDDTKINFDNNPTEPLFKFELTYKELRDMLFAKECKLNIIAHDNGWLWCEFIFNNNEDPLCASIYEKINSYDFLCYFANIDTVSLHFSNSLTPCFFKLSMAHDIYKITIGKNEGKA